jgi:hypothetical protein
MRGTLRRRLLLNAVVDPDEAAARLPAGLRPHVTPLGTVVGCCLLQIEHLRAAPLPASAGVSMLAAAHRISAEWRRADGETVVGVFVPGRRTDSRVAVAVGGRLFPGVHRPARLTLTESGPGLAWRVDGDGDFAIAAAVAPAPGAGEAEPCEPIGGTCLAATVGLSPSRRGGLEGAVMALERRDARQVLVERLRSPFIEGIRTAEAAPAYLMERVDVVWRRAGS